MKLNELIKIWKDDNEVESITQVETNEHDDGFIDYLYHILFKYRTSNYGRHAGLRVRVNRILEVNSHDIFNMKLDQNGNWVNAVRSWFVDWSNTYPMTDTDDSTSSNIIQHFKERND